MPLTPETLTRHELAGLPVRVVDADNPDLVGIAGRVETETMRTLRVRSDESRVRQVPKRGTTFEFALPESGRELAASATDEAAGGRRNADGPSGTARRDRKAPGSASELGTDTAGVRSGQSGPSASAPDFGSGSGFDSDSGTGSGEGGAASRYVGECEGAVYVTVDGARLLSRPALRTERAGDSTWR